MTTLCTLRNINLAFGRRIIFNQAELTVNEGDRIGLLGLNGKGKSTLFKILNLDVTPDISTPPFEFIKANKCDRDGLPFSLFHVPQEMPKDIPPSSTIKDVWFYFYPELHEIYKNQLEEFENRNGWKLLSEFESYLKFFNITEMNKTIQFLSGGELKKILVSLGLSADAQLILFDEPTNHLDLESIKAFEDELSQFNRSFILITHDRYLLSKVTNKIMHIDQGLIKSYQGNYTEYLDFLNLKEAESIKALDKLKNNLRRETEWIKRGAKARRTKSKKRIAEYSTLKNEISKIKSEAKKLLDFEVNNSKRQTKVLVDFKDVSFSYPNSPLLFKNLNFEINKKNKIGILGKNGVGKTTLIKLILNELQCLDGKIKTADNLKVQYFSQKRDEMESELSPYKILGDGTDYVILDGGQKKHVVSYFESFLFHRDDIHRLLKTFSGGEKSRLQLALNLTRPGDILIFDEPTNDLDLETIQILEHKLSEFEGAVLIISHDRTFLSNVTNKIFLVENKQITSFEVGFDQVEPYLEALELEQMALEDSNEAPILPAKVKPPVKNQNQFNLDSIYADIEKNEEKLKIIEDRIANFDFAKLKDKDNGELKILNDAQKFLQDKIAELYQQLEIIENK